MNPQTILKYLPQRPPFIFIDKLLKVENGEIVSSFKIPGEHILVENGVLTEAGIIENIAQTAAAGTGYKASIEQKPAPVGYIGAVKDLIVSEQPESGETITTEIIFLHDVLNASIVKGTVRIGENEIAACELKIFLDL